MAHVETPRQIYMLGDTRIEALSCTPFFTLATTAAGYSIPREVLTILNLSVKQSPISSNGKH